MAQKSLQLSCLCRGVQLTLSGQDKGAVICHCTNCKQFSGSAFAHNYRIMQAKVDYHNGQDLVRSYKDTATKSGNALNRFFCSRCVSFCLTKSRRVALTAGLYGYFEIQLLTRRLRALLL